MDVKDMRSLDEEFWSHYEREIDGRSGATGGIQQIGKSCYLYASVMLIMNHNGIRHWLSEACGDESQNPIVGWLSEILSHSMVCPHPPDEIIAKYNSLCAEYSLYAFSFTEGGYADIMIHALIWGLLGRCGYEYNEIPVQNNVQLKIYFDEINSYRVDDVGKSISNCDITKPIIYNLALLDKKEKNNGSFFRVFVGLQEFQDMLMKMEAFMKLVENTLTLGTYSDLPTEAEWQQFMKQINQPMGANACNAFVLNCTNVHGVSHSVLLVKKNISWLVLDGKYRRFIGANKWYARYVDGTEAEFIQVSTITAVFMPEFYQNATLP